jgi:ubiquitin-protein ligase
MPHLDDIRQIYGAIFVRRGLYKNGIFRFKIILPTTYNSLGSTPQILFTPPIFNPLVDKKVTNISFFISHLLTSLYTSLLMSPLPPLVL